jgi:hypothetical protein
MSLHSRLDEHLVIKAIACALLAIFAWIAMILSAPMLTRANSVTVWGDDARARKAIVLSHAHIAGKKGAFLLVERPARDLAADLVDNGAAIVLPAVVFDAF